jgi:hypothetical protein
MRLPPATFYSVLGRMQRGVMWSSSRAVLTRRWLCLLGMLVLPWGLAADTLTPTVSLNPAPRPISPYLVGLHQVYTFTPDHVFTEGEFPQWVRESGVSSSRFPGGTIVKYWDWEHPNGQPFEDPLSPEFDATENTPASEWMSLDEFLAWVDRTGIEPIFGVNSLEGRVHDREAATIARAVRMVRYVKEHGHGGGLWYIGNEEAHLHGGIAGYAQTFRRYAEAIKAEDPDIRIFWNDNNPNATRIEEFLAHDGGTADGLETHGKWPYGGKPKLPPGTFEEWRDEVPLRDRKNGDRSAGGRAWRYAADEYRAIATAAGRTLLIANNEYGLGSGSNVVGFNRYTTGLLLSEMVMEHVIGDWFTTCFWDLTRGPETGLLDGTNGYRLNPLHLGMTLLAPVQGGRYLQTLTTAQPGVHGFIAGQDGVIIVCLLNKSTESHTLQLDLRSQGYRPVRALRMQDSADGYGELAVLAPAGFSDHLVLPPLTMTQWVWAPASPLTPPIPRP